MYNAEFTIVGVTPLSGSRPLTEKRGDREDAGAFEKRIWRQKFHTTADGHIKIPAAALKGCICDTASFLSLKVPGKRNATFTKHFEAGTIIEDDLILGHTIDQAREEEVYCHADGKRGSGTRVWRSFPTIDAGWRCDATILVLDDIITPETLKLHLDRAGQFMGLGRWRPRNRGQYGRFRIEGFKTTEVQL